MPYSVVKKLAGKNNSAVEKYEKDLTMNNIFIFFLNIRE